MVSFYKLPKLMASFNLLGGLDKICMKEVAMIELSIPIIQLVQQFRSRSVGDILFFYGRAEAVGKTWG